MLRLSGRKVVANRWNVSQFLKRQPKNEWPENMRANMSYFVRHTAQVKTRVWDKNSRAEDNILKLLSLDTIYVYHKRHISHNVTFVFFPCFQTSQQLIVHQIHITSSYWILSLCSACVIIVIWDLLSLLLLFRCRMSPTNP